MRVRGREGQRKSEREKRGERGGIIIEPGFLPPFYSNRESR